MRAKVKDNEMYQSFALTDASGNYVINLTSAEAGKVEKVSIQDNIQPYVSLPLDSTLTITKSFTGINFIAAAAAAKIVGYLKTDAAGVLSNIPVRCKPNQGGGDETRKTVYTDANGFFAFGFTSAECASYPLWSMEINSQLAPSYVAPITGSISVHDGDSLRVDMLAYVANATITGKITIDGKIPSGQSFMPVAYIQDTVSSWSSSNATTGEFTLYVTSKLHSYAVGVYDVGDEHAFDWSTTKQYAPGATGVELNVVSLSWIAQSTPTGNDLNCVAFPTSSVGYAAGNMGTILGTVDGGTTWTALASNSTSDMRAIFFISATTGWVGGTNGTIKKTTNGGVSWAAQNSGISYPINILQFTDANNGWAMDVDFFLRTTNGGSTWSTVTTGPQETMLAFNMINSTTGFMLTGWGNVYKTTNGGTSWTMAGSPGGYYSRIKFADASTGYICGNGNNVLVTTDGGANWTTNNLSSSNLNDIFVLNASTAWVVGNNNTIYKTTNTGASWIHQLTSQNGSYSLNGVSFADGNNGWLVGSNGSIYHTINGGMVGVRDAAAGKAESFNLAQNYPNPFNPSTVINYTVPQKSGSANHVLLKVYNMMGQEVAVLVNKEQSAGNYSASFSGHGLASGIYLYSLQMNGQSITKKMMLLK